MGKKFVQTRYVPKTVFIRFPDINQHTWSQGSVFCPQTKINCQSGRYPKSVCWELYQTASMSGRDMTLSHMKSELIFSCFFMTSTTFKPGGVSKSIQFTSVILEHTLRTTFLSTPCENVLRWIPQINFDDRLTLVQVITWCRQEHSLQYVMHHNFIVMA